MNIMRRHRIAGVFAFIGFILTALPTWAAADPEQAAKLVEWQAQIEFIEKTTGDEDVTSAQFSSLREQLDEISSQLSGFSTELAPQLDDVSGKLEQLGEAPAADAAPESETIAVQRQALVEQKAEISGHIKQAELLQTEIERLVAFVSGSRRALFTKELLKRTKSPFSLSLWRDVWRLGTEEVRSVAAMIDSWLRYTVQARIWTALMALGTAVLTAVFLTYASRVWILPRIISETFGETPSRLRLSVTAISVAIIPTVAVAISAYATYVLFDQFGLMIFRIDRLFSAILIAVVGITATHNLFSALLNPKAKTDDWRLADIPETSARRLKTLFLATAVVYGADYVASELNEVMSTPLTLTIARTILSVTLIGLLLLAIVRVPLVEADDRKPSAGEGWLPVLRRTLMLFIIAIFATTALGFIGLARFLSTQLIVTGSILVFMYLLFLTARALSSAEDATQSFFGRYLKQRFGFEEGTIEQIGLALGIALDFLILITGIPLILLQWGFKWDDVSRWITTAMTGFRVGNVEISLATIFTALVVFTIGLVIAQYVKQWLQVRIISRMRVDPSIKNSISVGVGYVGVVMAAAFAIAYAGIDLSNLALIAGALSVGIGFGLQNIVSNFVSGLILLIERPIKVGDWIGVGAHDGFVKRISVRATEIETLDRQSVVVPNGELINTAVSNWMLKDKLGRISVAVGVSYASDERQVRDILLEVAKGHPQIASSPEPDVIFRDFGESSLDFELRVFLKDVGKTVPVSSDLRFAIRDALRQANIEIPFPQRDLHLRSAEALDGKLPIT